MNGSVYLGKGYPLFGIRRTVSPEPGPVQSSNLSPRSSSVELGESEALHFSFGDKISFSEELLGRPDLVAYILGTHTFIQGKIGFYEQILTQLLAKEEEQLLAKEEESVCASKYVYTIHHLPHKTKYRRLIILPRESSPEAVNRLIAKALSLNQMPLWLIAHPLFVYPHLLMNFHNLFIVVNSPEELKSLQQVLNLPKRIVSIILKSPIPQALFVTDFERVARSSGELVAATRLEIDL